MSDLDFDSDPASDHAGCPMDALLRLLMGPWTTYVLWVLRSRGTQRFGALKRAIPGISSRLLTARLRLLEQAGVVRREHVATIPPQVSYSLTARGAELAPVLDALDALARKWDAEDRSASRRASGRTASAIAA